EAPSLEPHDWIAFDLLAAKRALQRSENRRLACPPIAGDQDRARCGQFAHDGSQTLRKTAQARPNLTIALFRSICQEKGNLKRVVHFKSPAIGRARAQRLSIQQNL